MMQWVGQRLSKKRFIAAAGVALFMFAGCVAPQKPAATAEGELPPPAKPVADPKPAKIADAAFDLCANHLHDDVSAALLLYLSSHLDYFPPTLADLKKVPGFADLDLTCPITHEPYAYASNGLIIPNDDARIVIYDSKPSHGGFRWGIRVMPRVAGRPPSTAVVPITDELFSQLRAAP